MFFGAIRCCGNVRSLQAQMLSRFKHVKLALGPSRVWKSRSVDFTPRKHATSYILNLMLTSVVKLKDDGGQILFICRYHAYNRTRNLRVIARDALEF